MAKAGRKAYLSLQSSPTSSPLKGECDFLQARLLLEHNQEHPRNRFFLLNWQKSGSASHSTVRLKQSFQIKTLHLNRPRCWMFQSNAIFKSIDKHKRFHTGSYIIHSLVTRHLMGARGMAIGRNGLFLQARDIFVLLFLHSRFSKLCHSEATSYQMGPSWEPQVTMK